ncbi:thiosulfate sulfurtransferase-like [Lingula anatina]|uniref:Thiosulfate sulfurtransferase-like n=1 Tax=Lingula anatina TaxID=7574 RepID=A0A1S3ITA1_LINAN|nr:thiosulfate sulfurtransferase-like [Lingula anatina]|eukprot:XP_013401427.1 thiosulfate sulfurtransferase-like [Lingula anatina]
MATKPADGDTPLLVSSAWLKEHLAEAAGVGNKLRILDVTWYSAKNGKDDFDRSHIPGALFFELMKDVENTPLFPRNLPPPEKFQEQVRSLGIDNDTHVVLYDNIPGKNGFFIGGRAFWMFKHFGHEKVSILDGGLAKWIADGYNTTSDTISVNKGNFTAKPNNNFIRSFDEVIPLLTNQMEQIVDGRSSDQFNNTAGGYVGGHMPNAYNVPFESLLDSSTGCMKSPEELRKVFADSGLNENKPVVTLCNGGVSSCSVMVAAMIAGFPQAAVYHGGWTEWKQKAAPEQIIQP